MSDYAMLFMNKYTYNDDLFSVKNPTSIYEILWYFDIPHNDIIKNFKKTMELHQNKKLNYYSYTFHSLTKKEMSVIMKELRLYYAI